MRCLYCHNPETQNPCNHCGECIAACPSGALSKPGEAIQFDNGMCIRCDRCLDSCPNFSTPKCIETTADELYQHISRNAVFLDGITVSGGEATLQAGFILELFRTIKESTHLTTFIDTNGFIGVDALSRLNEVTDGFMVDLKALNPAKHLRLTGVENTPVLKTIQFLGKTERLYEIRTVIVPGFTDDKNEIRHIAAWVRDLNHTTRLKLIPFRPLGVKSYLNQKPPLDEKRFDALSEEAEKILGNRVVF